MLQGRHDDKTPDRLKFDFALWSSKAIKEYVQREYGMSISRRTARWYMQKMGFTYQCPVKTAREQNPALVRKWLETDCPAIRKNLSGGYSTRRKRVMPLPDTDINPGQHNIMGN